MGQVAWSYLWNSPRPAIRWLVILTYISLILSSWAWIVISSVFNGFTSFLEEVFQRVDPHIRIIGTGISDSLKQKIAAMPATEAVAGIYERIGIIRYGQRQAIVRVRFVDDSYGRVSQIGQQVVYGVGFPLEERGALIGAGVAARIVLLDREESPLWLYIIPSGRHLALTGVENLPRKNIIPQGIFSVQKEYDENWLIVSQRDWPNISGSYDVLEIRLKREKDIGDFTKEIRQTLPPSLIAQEPRRQHEGLFRILAQEKLLAMSGLGLLFLLTASGVICTLSTFLIHNKRDWALYQALGASPQWTYRLVSSIGWILLGIGGLTGMLLGILTVWTQDTFQWAKLRGGEGSLLQYFPVRLQIADIVELSGILILTGVGISLYTYYSLRKLSYRSALQGD
ncbi:MAG: FtsX-like permease family protein [Bacteroidia bacterium]|nr:hypothetical protein [Bacteroidia bacterium]MDW8134543.1 FtsX-like permease family protein [Bacteroidia bacterium]